MHRRLIHGTFDCSKTVERVLVWLGVMVGMAGPFGILRIHDLRDWAQRETECHDFFAHRRSIWTDAFWQLHCAFQFRNPPRFVLEPQFALDHNPGPGRWIVRDAGVQAANLPGWGFLTHGECWHNNHHAFPESARMGLAPGEVDPGWYVLRLLNRLHLVSNLRVPREPGQRDDLCERAEPAQPIAAGRLASHR